MPSSRVLSFTDDVDYAEDDASYIVLLGERTLRLSQVRWNGTAQLRAQCMLYERRSLLFQTEIDLIGLADRERLLRSLQPFEGESESWAADIHAFFARTIQHEAHIEQPICISDAPPRTTERFVTVGGMPLLASDFTMLFGDGGSMKSLLSLWWAAQLSTELRVMWLDWEMRVEDHQERLVTLFGDTRFEDLFHLTGTAPLSQMEDVLRQHIRTLGIRFLVVDSAAAASPGKNGSPSDMPTEFFQTLRRLDVGALIIGHTTKAGEDMKPMGSVYWHNSVRASWHVAASEGWVTLTNRKDSHGGPLAEGECLQYHITRPSTTHTRIELVR